jgi:hypothetical protein
MNGTFIEAGSVAVAARAGRLIALAAVVVLALAACSTYDPAPLSEFFDLRIVNDTSQTVKIEPCWNPTCGDRTGMPTDTLKPGSYRDEAAWLNNVGGTVAVAVLPPGSGTMRCVRVHFVRGQQNGIVQASAAQACRAVP